MGLPASPPLAAKATPPAASPALSGETHGELKSSSKVPSTTCFCPFTSRHHESTSRCNIGRDWTVVRFGLSPSFSIMLMASNLSRSRLT